MPIFGSKYLTSALPSRAADSEYTPIGGEAFLEEQA